MENKKSKGSDDFGFEKTVTITDRDGNEIEIEIPHVEPIKYSDPFPLLEILSLITVLFIVFAACYSK